MRNEDEKKRPKLDKRALASLRRDADKAQKPNSWDFSNDVIYRMCAKNPGHQTNGEIVGKLLVIGRVYSAALERRKSKKKFDSDFYLDEALPRIKHAKFDSLLKNQNLKRNLTIDNAHHFVRIHQNVNSVFEKIAGLSKRSLASKYLHFHLPTKFFLYDTRAVKGLSGLMGELDLNASTHINLVKSRLKNHEYDDDYTKHFVKCLVLRDFIRDNCRVDLQPRPLDKLLLRLFD